MERRHASRVMRWGSTVYGYKPRPILIAGSQFADIDGAGHGLVWTFQGEFCAGD